MVSLFVSLESKKRKKLCLQSTCCYHQLQSESIINCIMHKFCILQMRPSSYPKRGLFGDSKMVNFTDHGKEEANEITQFWHLNESCPERTIPIRRTKKEDFLIASYIKNYGKMKHQSIPHLSSAFGKLSNQAGQEVSYINTRLEILL